MEQIIKRLGDSQVKEKGQDFLYASNKAKEVVA